jgi:hypothetical protein
VSGADAWTAHGLNPAPQFLPGVTPLDKAHAVFQRWLGAEYDLDALDAVLAVAAAERLAGDPAWLLLVSGSGNAKTETVQSLAGSGAHVTSTITSEGALLSGTPKREGKGGTGGLLRVIGSSGVLVIKDVTSILSMHRDARTGVLAAFREIHDGNWTRNIGSDGGKTIPWRGRIALIGAVTTAWDRAHDVISSMGDRFVILRLDSTKGRTASGRRAIQNTGSEEHMRQELAHVVEEVVGHVKRHQDVDLTDEENEKLLVAADLVTLCRTGVDYDYRGDVIDSHAPEMPTRFTKQLAQVARGALAVGLSRPGALRLALRCARDSMPPLRLSILLDVHAHPYSTTPDVRKRLNKPRNTVDRQLQALHMLGVLVCDEVPLASGNDKPRSSWHYSVDQNINPAVLTVPDLSPHIHENTEKSVPAADISGTPASFVFDGDPFGLRAVK